jgi:glucose-1-phosphate cytidylyltransferase
MLTYGDGVGNVDIKALLDFHKSHGKLATITSVHPPTRFGELEVDGTQVTSFQEKPQAAAGQINGGFFVCDPGVFDYIKADQSCSFEREPLQNLARDGQLMTFTHDGFWMPMDTFREYTLLNDMWQRGEAPWVWPGA